MIHTHTTRDTEFEKQFELNGEVHKLTGYFGTSGKDVLAYYKNETTKQERWFLPELEPVRCLVTDVWWEYVRPLDLS